MPVKKELRVEATNHYGKGIRLGDFLTLPRGISGIVESLETKTTYLHVTLVSGTKGRLPLKSEVNVCREVPTEDEENAAGMSVVTEEVMKNWKHFKSAMNNGLSKLREVHKDRMAKGYTNPIDFDLMAQIKLDEMRWAIYETIRISMTDLMTDTNTPEGGAALRAVMRARHRLRMDLTKPYQGALSRSSSVISNLEDDMKRQVQAEFLQESNYWGVETLWERVGVKL